MSKPSCLTWAKRYLQCDPIGQNFAIWETFCVFSGYYSRWPKFFNFIPLKAFSSLKIFEIFKKLVKMTNFYWILQLFKKLKFILLLFFINFDTLAVHLGTNTVACQKRLSTFISQKCLGLLFEKFGLLFDQTVWSHWLSELVEAPFGHFLPIDGHFLRLEQVPSRSPVLRWPPRRSLNVTKSAVVGSRTCRKRIFWRSPVISALPTSSPSLRRAASSTGILVRLGEM